MRCYQTIWGVSECSGRDHANNVLLASNRPFNSNVRHWSHPLMMTLNCLWCKWKDRTRSQFEYDMTLFKFSSYANKTGSLQNKH